MSLFDGVFLLMALAVGFLIMFGGRSYVPKILRTGFWILVALALAPCIFQWLTGAALDARDEFGKVPTFLVVLMGVGHVAAGVAYLRHRLVEHARPDARATERNRIRARERTRLPPRGEE